jgi:hypothetical protein
MLSTEHPANVAYQEFDVPVAFPLHLRQYLPNNFYSAATGEDYQDQRWAVDILL